MAIILNLPVELVAKILRGMFLCDILSTTQTCCYLRSISLNNRNIWAHAQDCEIIPLPPGETLASINVDILPRYVRRAISLGQRWKEPINSSVRHFEPRFHDLPTWRPWVLPPSPDYLGFKSPQWCHILPGGQSFLIGKPFPSRVGLYGLNGTWGHLFDFRGQVSFVGWSSTDNGASLTLILVVLNKENGILCKRLCIYDVQYDLTTIQPMKPTVSQPRYICLPIFILPKGLSVQRSIVLTWDTDSLCLVDLTTNEALHLQSAPHNKSSRIIHAALHPSIPFTVVLLSEQDTSKTRILSVVSNISDLETLPSAECYELKPRELILRDIVNVDIPDPERQLYLPGLPYFVFHKRGENIAIDDVNTRSVIPIFSIDSRIPPSSVSKPISRPSPAALKDTCDYFWPCETQSGQLFLFILRGNRVHFCQYDSMEALISLDPIATRFILSHRFHPSSVKVAFDPVYGVLVLISWERVLVLQY